MPFSARHRFMKVYGLHYGWNMKIEDIAEYSGESIEVLKAIYDKKFEECKKNAESMNAVYMHCNHVRTEVPTLCKTIQFHEGVRKVDFK